MVESRPAAGSVFRLILKLLPAGPVIAGTGDPAEAVNPVALYPWRILVAEDQATNRWLIERQLQRLGCPVVAVENGRVALAVLESGTFDLLISDCHMPEIDGVALTQMIRAGEAAHGAPHMLILGLTADVSTEMRNRCLAAGMDDIVAKPIDLRRLREALASLTHPGDAEPVAADNPVASAVFDAANCRELFADDAAEGREWLTSFLDSAHQLVADVECGIANGDRDLLTASAHKLAGASLAAGAIDLGWLARRLEAVSPCAPEPELRELTEQIVAAWDNARQAIGDFVATPEAVT
jgi:CheY-like chemotaxis protein/HPt (histidine-containing phosphotransfer) domain-containing protein